jgi:hypothetical protein
MVTKEIIQSEVENRFIFLTDLGYISSRYDTGSEYGVFFKSKVRNRFIEITLQAHRDGVVVCYIRRNYPKWFPFLYKDINGKVFFDLNNRLKDDQEFSLVHLALNVENYRDVLQNYASFIQKRFTKVITGDMWID